MATYNYVLVALGLCSKYEEKSLKGFCNVHSNVCHTVLREGDQDWDELSPDRVSRDDLSEGGDAEERCLPMQVVRIRVEGDQSWHCKPACPLCAKYLRQLFEVLNSGLTNREN